MKKKADIELIIFIFSILFLPKIGLIDLKMIASIIFLGISLARDKRLVLEGKMVFSVLIIGLLIVLFIVNSLLNDTDYLILMRYIRCLLSVVCVSNYIRTKKTTDNEVVQAVSIVIALHAIAIIVSVLFPASRPAIEFISRYNKKYLSLRSTGLLSGYDFAGMFLNSAFTLRIIYNVKEKNKIFDTYCYLYIIATIFTSRLNTLLLMVEVVVVVLYMLKTQRISSSVSLIIIIPIMLAGSVFSILTIQAFASIKVQLVQHYQWIAKLDRTINLTYSDSSVLYDIIESHYDIAPEINRIIGNGITVNKDPGIIKTIYEGGCVAVVLKFLFYLDIFTYSLRRKRAQYIYVFLLIYILLNTIYEFKLQFYFATGAFELLITFFTVGRHEELQSSQEVVI